MEELPKKEQSGFFSASISVIKAIACTWRRPEHVAVYLTICRYKQNRGPGAGMVSTAGLNALEKKLDISRRLAGLVAGDLEEFGYITSREKVDDPETALPTFMGKAQGRQNTVRWVLDETQSSDDLVYLPNGIIDGVGRGKENPLIHKIMTRSGTAKLPKETVRLDTLTVLAALYYHHQLADFGGVDPSQAIYRDWTKDCPDDIESVVGELALTGVYSKGEATKWLVYREFLELALPGESSGNENVKERFFNVIKWLQTEGYIYEVLQIWSGNPTTDRYAEVMYPLYIFDHHMRQKEPSMYKVINSKMAEQGVLHPCITGENAVGAYEDLGNIYLYFHKRDETVYPLSVYRLKYKPSTADAAKWVDRERVAVEDWTARIKAI